MNSLPQSTGWQAGFLQILPTVQTHAAIQFRKLPVEQREEAIQEAIASACISYQRLAIQSRLHAARPSTLATFAVNFVRNGRHVGGRQDAAKDVLSPRCQQRHGVRVQSIDVRREKRDSNDWKQLVLADRNESIPDTAAFRIDFEQWLATLAERDRRIINLMISQEPGFIVANRFGVTPARVSHLRRRYEREWHIFQGEGAAAA